MPDTGVLTRGLSFAPQSVDERTRTVDLVASTGAGVLRRDMAGEFLEVLSLAPGAVDLSHADGMPLLDSHRQDELERVLGVVRSIRMERDQLIVRVQFSERPSADAYFRDVKAGIIRNVSVGYLADDAQETQDPASGRRTRLVTRWTLLEVSLVPVGADAGAKTRGRTMPDITPNNPAPIVTVTPPAATTTPPAPTNRAAVNQEIRALAETFELGPTFADPLIDRGATVDEARAAAIEEVRTRANRPGPQARVTVLANHDSPELMVRNMGEALYLRANPRHQVSEPARRYVGLTTLDMARHCLQLRGIAFTGMSMAETITRALHTTSDFPLIFADTANRSLRQAYEAAPATLKRVARQTTAKDFRARTKLQISEAASLEKVNENGEYKYSTFTESGESITLGTFGRIFAISRKAIINDDVGAFADLAGKFGQAAAEFEAQFLVDLLTGGGGLGPTMSDTKTLFHTDHGNLQDAGIAGTNFNENVESLGQSLGAARLAMRRQTGLTGQVINVPPKFLIVPPELEMIGEVVVAQVQPHRAADVNPFGGKLDLLVEARLTDTTTWYLAADPAVCEGLEYSYLQGAEGPQTESRAGFEVDGVETKVRLDFGAGFVDWRSWYQNGGDSQ